MKSEIMQQIVKNDELNSEIELIRAENRWLYQEGFKMVVDRLLKSSHYRSMLWAMQQASHRLGLFVGLETGYLCCERGKPMKQLSFYRLNAQQVFHKTVNDLRRPGILIWMSWPLVSTNLSLSFAGSFPNQCQ